MSSGLGPVKASVVSVEVRESGKEYGKVKMGLDVLGRRDVEETLNIVFANADGSAFSTARGGGRGRAAGKASGSGGSVCCEDFR